MSLLQDLTVQQIVTRIFAMLIYAAVQGALLAWLARGLGDVRPAREGRLTLNPFLQASAWGVAMGVLFRMGWIAPLRLSPAQGFGERVRILLIVAAGLGAMLALVPLLDLLRAPLQQMLPRTAGYYVLYALQMVQEVTFGSVALNLLPVPGLIGHVRSPSRNTSPSTSRSSTSESTYACASASSSAMSSSATT